MRRIARRAIIGLVAAVLVVAIALLAGQSSTGASPGAASIALEDFRFTPNRLDAKVKVPLSVRLTNQGTEQHDLNFPSLHMPSLQGVESVLAPGETRMVTLEFDQPGTHTFICTLPGHAAAGMTGAVYVSQ
jgi:plastocyanin